MRRRSRSMPLSLVVILRTPEQVDDAGDAVRSQ
jgi:hypothetical protein